MIGEDRGYIDQYERMKRFRARLEDYTGEQKIYEDDMWACFQAIYHLKDWLGHDFPLLRQDIEDHITNGQHLKIGADLANRSKHMKLTRRIRGGNADINRNNATVGLTVLAMSLTQGNDPPKEKPNEQKATRFWEYFIDIPGGASFSHKELADKMIVEWDAFIRTKGI
jgi:hypothetical protein